MIILNNVSMSIRYAVRSDWRRFDLIDAYYANMTLIFIKRFTKCYTEHISTFRVTMALMMSKMFFALFFSVIPQGVVG